MTVSLKCIKEEIKKGKGNQLKPRCFLCFLSLRQIQKYGLQKVWSTVFPADLSDFWNAATSASTFRTRMLCKMQISILRGCGSKRAEVSLNLAWECCTMPVFYSKKHLFPLQKSHALKTEVKITLHWSRSSALAGRWLLQLLQWTLLFTRSLRDRKCPAFRSGSGRLWRNWCISKPAVMFDSTIDQLGWFFAGWGGGLDSNTNCA